MLCVLLPAKFYAEFKVRLFLLNLHIMSLLWVITDISLFVPKGFDSNSVSNLLISSSALLMFLWSAFYLLRKSSLFLCLIRKFSILRQKWGNMLSIRTLAVYLLNNNLITTFFPTCLRRQYSNTVNYSAHMITKSYVNVFLSCCWRYMCQGLLLYFVQIISYPAWITYCAFNLHSYTHGQCVSACGQSEPSIAAFMSWQN